MRIDPRFASWGFFFVVVGAIPLAIRAGLLDAGTLAGWWTLWPLLLIGAGLGILLRRTPFEFLGGLLVAGVFGLLVGAAIGAGTSFDLGKVACAGSGGGTPFAGSSGTLAPGGSVDLEIDCGDLTVGVAAGESWTLAGSSHDGTAPAVDASSTALAIRSRQSQPGVVLGTNRETWQVSAPASATTYALKMNAGSAAVSLAGSQAANVSATVNAGSLRADLSGAPIRRIDVTVNAGSARLDLPAASIDGSLTVNAGSIAFCAPPGVGLQLQTNENLTGGNNYGARGLTKSGTTWTSPNWPTATNRITLSTSANAGGFTLNPEDGCK